MVNAPEGDGHLFELNVLVSDILILWMDEILHHFGTMGTHCLLAFTGKPSFQGFLGGAGSTL